MSASRETTTSVLRAFEAGTDDVTRTPLGYAELLARVRALLRRHSLIDGPAVIVCGPLEIDTAARIATFDGVPVELRRQEFALLAHLARDPARVHEKQDLLHAVWGLSRYRHKPHNADVLVMPMWVGRAGLGVVIGVVGSA